MTSMQGRLRGWRWRFRDYLSKVMRASQVVLVVKNLPANAGDIRDGFDPWIRDQKDPLEEGIVTHSSVLAWRIPWTEEPGGLQSLRSQKAGHN